MKNSNTAISQPTRPIKQEDRFAASLWQMSVSLAGAALLLVIPAGAVGLIAAVVSRLEPPMRTVPFWLGAGVTWLSAILLLWYRFFRIARSWREVPQGTAALYRFQFTGSAAVLVTAWLRTTTGIGAADYVWGTVLVFYVLTCMAYITLSWALRYRVSALTYVGLLAGIATSFLPDAIL